MTSRTSTSPDPVAHNGATTEQVVARVYDLIRRGRLRPGDRLPPERDFARQLGISRPSLRAGLRSLIAMGVLRARQGSGTFVAEGPPQLDSGQLSLLAALHGFTYDQMFEARKVLEVNVAGMAATRATGEQLSVLADELAAMQTHISDPQQYLLHDIRFHRAVAAASDNPILATLMEMVSAVMYEHRRQTIGRAHDFRQSLEMHESIYHAILNHQPDEARAKMQQHLDLAQQAYHTEEAIELALTHKAVTDPAAASAPASPRKSRRR